MFCKSMVRQYGVILLSNVSNKKRMLSQSGSYFPDCSLRNLSSSNLHLVLFLHDEKYMSLLRYCARE